MAGAPVVAILNTNDDIVELLRIVFEQAGLIAVSAHVDSIRRGEQSLLDFITEHDPPVVLYDIAPPYDASWRYFEHLRDMPAMRGRRFVITSTNPRRLAEIIGDAGTVHEIIGKPYDIDEILRAIQRALGPGDLPGSARDV